MVNRVGQQLGNYRLVRLLGQGGFADVYLGEHLRLNTQAAIKVLHTSLGDDDQKDFLREAQTVARLKHPHIVRVFDFDIDVYTPFLVMDYLPNGNLRRFHPKDTPLPRPTILSYVAQIASALQYAHNEKLIHRDIKPENMLLDHDNTLVLSDFGIALMSQSSRLQNTQEVAGTASYMAPEQFQGKPQRASDQYSLGVVVYEWLTGDRPFHGSFSEIASQHLFVPPPPLREKVSTISPEVEQIVMTALEKDPHKRFGSVRAFATALEQANWLEESTLLRPVSKAPVTQPVYPTPTPPISPTKQAIAFPPKQPTESVASSVIDSAILERGHETSEHLPSSSIRPKSKMSLWSIGNRQILTIVLGAVLFGGLRSLFIPLLPNQSTDWSIMLFPILLAILLFGELFGPWVGLFTGGGGYLLSTLLSQTSIFWFTCLSYALMGIIAGLALLKTEGRYNTIRTIALLELFGAIGLIIGRGFSYSVGIWITHTVTLENIVNTFLHQELPSMVVTLILLPFLLASYNAVFRRIHDNKMWHIGKRQIVAMIIGAVLCGLNILLLVVIVTFRLNVDVPIIGSYVLILLPLVTILFFGVVFGPWVGAVTGAGGVIIFAIIFRGFQQVVAVALIGFIAGLTLLKTGGHYHKLSNFAAASAVSFVGSIVGLTFYAAPYIPIGEYALVSAIASLILLPCLLIISNKVVGYVMIRSVQSTQQTNVVTPSRHLSVSTISPPHSLSIPRTTLLIGLAFVIIAGSVGLFGIMRANQIAVENAQTTATANTFSAQTTATTSAFSAQTTATASALSAQATATTSAFNAHATATVRAAIAATATIVAKNPDPYPPTTGKLALYDPLDKPGYWVNGSNTSFGGSCLFTNGAYHVSQLQSIRFFNCSTPTLDLSNFAFEVQMNIIKGDCGGFVFRFDGSIGKMYVFQVCQSGYYGLYRFTDYNNSVLLTRNSSSAIATGLNQSNSIAVVANGNTFDLYINTQKMVTISDNSYSHGQIGLIADDLNSSTDVKYTFAKAWRL